MKVTVVRLLIQIYLKEVSISPLGKSISMVMPLFQLEQLNTLKENDGIAIWLQGLNSTVVLWAHEMQLSKNVTSAHYCNNNKKKKVQA